MAWYMVVTDGNNENEYDKFPSDQDAIDGFLSWAKDEGIAILEICRCDDDECLTPAETIWT